jgi:V8-like Glu-specific endopeptidase
VSAVSVTPRIVGGSDTTLAEHPWQVSVYFGSSQPVCGGVILDRWHVLTAAHCLLDSAGQVEPASSIFVLAGVTDQLATPLPDEQFIQALRLEPMESYGTPLAESHDAGLITLSEPLVFGQDVAPATVTTTSATPPEAGDPLTVTGWGYTATAGPASPVLQATTVGFVPDADCPGAFTAPEAGAEFDPATMLCAITQGQDACSGDSGGPLTTAAGTLVGLVSWGPETCGGADGPGVYTELAEPSINAFALAPHIVGLSGPVRGAPGEPATFAAVVGDNDTPAGALRFTWDLDGDGVYDDADTGATPSVATNLPPTDGTTSVGVQVSDDSSTPLTDTARQSVTVVSPPRPVNTNPVPPAAPAPAPEPVAVPDLTGPAVKIRSVTRSGRRALIRLSCAGEPGCHGVITLRTARRVATRNGRRTVSVGRAEFRIGWQEGVVRITLSSTARRLLARGNLPVAVSVLAFDAAGNSTRRSARATLRRR